MPRPLVVVVVVVGIRVHTCYRVPVLCMCQKDMLWAEGEGWSSLATAGPKLALLLLQQVVGQTVVGNSLLVL